MALTKLPKAGLATGSVSTSQIEDGTIQNQEFEDSTLTSAKLADSTIANAKLSNSSFTINGTSVNLGAAITAKAVVEWQSVITADGSTTTTSVAGKGYFIDTTNHEHTINLPSSAAIGDTISFKDYAGTFGTNKLIIGRNSHKIQGTTVDSKLTTNRAQVTLVYVDATKGWLYTDEHNVGDNTSPVYTSATGGTETTSGNYKIHKFTSSSNFVVSTVGNTAGGTSEVSYMVVAGGGSGASNLGGGGAGGFREGRASNDSYSVSPLNAPSGLTITAQTYPITVGAGGAVATGPDSFPGNNSIFSTITSAGGGGGNRAYDPSPAGDTGGSGGGGSSTDNDANHTHPGGAGNTPPVSPPQGNPGGNSNGSDGSNWSSGGGGGAGGAGGNAPGSNRGGDGGIGVSTSILGSSNKYAGGGGGGMYQFGNTSDYGGDAAPGFGGGFGGGGAGRFNSSKGPGAGTANTGGGGAGEGVTSSGHGQPTPHQNSGGSGIVIIRYKYQN